MKLFFVFFTILLAPGFISAQETINFEWESVTLGDQVFPHAAMLVPVNFPEDSTTYYLQLDTGAHYSSLYSQRFGFTNLHEGTVKTSLGLVKFRINESLPPSQKKNASVGTLGADFLKEKIVLLDYRNQKIKFVKTFRPEDFSLTPMKLLDGRPSFNINLEGETVTVLYDSGASLFGLWTDKRKWDKIRNRIIHPQKFPITSWGEINSGFRSPIAASQKISIGRWKMADELDVWFVDNKKFKRFFRRNDLYGILGNQPFQNQIILLDFVNQKFGVLKEKESLTN